MKKEEVQETSFGVVNDAYDGDEKNGGKKTADKTKSRAVSMKELFRFCGKRERFLIIVGTIGAIIHGSAFPVRVQNFCMAKFCSKMEILFENRNLVQKSNFVRKPKFCSKTEILFQN